jgi:outer membrane lipoprotein-sorting protein
MRLHRLNLLIVFILTTNSAFASASLESVFKSAVIKATHKFRDITLTCKVLYANQAELKKIGKDFGKSYEFKSTNVYFKKPDKMKIEGKLGMLGAKIIINGNRKATIIPGLHISKKENIADEPHKKQTDLDLGIISDSLWRDYIILKVEREKTTTRNIYRVTFVRPNSREKRLVAWLDSSGFKLLKLEKYESDGTLKVRYIYSHHIFVDKLIWIPCRIDVYSPDGKLAGTTVYENIKVNTNIPDSEFAF